MEKSDPKFYTTTKAAEICMCSSHTIRSCCDKGLILGYRLPGSKHRRIPANKLYNYMKENNIPTDNFPKEDIPKKGLEHLAKTKK